MGKADKWQKIMISYCSLKWVTHKVWSTLTITNLWDKGADKSWQMEVGWLANCWWSLTRGVGGGVRVKTPLNLADIFVIIPLSPWSQWEWWAWWPGRATGRTGTGWRSEGSWITKEKNNLSQKINSGILLY